VITRKLKLPGDAAAWQQVIRIKKGREYPAFLPVLEEFY
tara:strand:- start:769 stop:885 length:117 start_codon:yes stop_codon:yes gene_type:complete